MSLPSESGRGEEKKKGKEAQTEEELFLIPTIVGANCKNSREKKFRLRGCWGAKRK